MSKSHFPVIIDLPARLRKRLEIASHSFHETAREFGVAEEAR